MAQSEFAKVVSGQIKAHRPVDPWLRGQEFEEYLAQAVPVAERFRQLTRKLGALPLRANAWQDVDDDTRYFKPINMGEQEIDEREARHTIVISTVRLNATVYDLEVRQLKEGKEELSESYDLFDLLEYTTKKHHVVMKDPSHHTRKVGADAVGAVLREDRDQFREFEPVFNQVLSTSGIEIIEPDSSLPRL